MTVPLKYQCAEVILARSEIHFQVSDLTLSTCNTFDYFMQSTVCKVYLVFQKITKYRLARDLQHTMKPFFLKKLIYICPVIDFFTLKPPS